MKSTSRQYWDKVCLSWERRRSWLWRRHSDAVNCGLLRRWLPSAGMDAVLKTDLFDEMCGEGLFPVLEPLARSVVGIDLSPSVLRSARGRHAGLRAVAADVLRLPFPDGSFACVVSNSTLDHLESVERIADALAELHRVMLPGGELIITLDNPSNPMVAIRNLISTRLLIKLGITPYFVGATCGAKQLRRLLEGEGYSVREEAWVMHCPRVLAVALARVLEKVGLPGLHRAYLRIMMWFECLSGLPTRRLTGYFVAVRATRENARPAPRPGSEGGQ